MSGDRTTRLRAWHLAHRPSVCHERAEIVTEVYEAHAGTLPPVRLRAAALAAILDRQSIFIAPDELIVGHQASRPSAAPVFPEYAWGWVLEELDSLPRRAADRFDVPAETRERLHAILPRWRGRSFLERAVAALPAEALEAHQQLLFLLTSLGCGTGHLAPDYERILRGGLNGLVAEAQARLAALDLTAPEALPVRDFLMAAIQVARAAVGFARRHADLADKQAQAEPDGRRRAELVEISRICRRVPAEPAQTFQEALQAFWFLHLIIQIESNGHSISPGRFDQYLWPFYAADMAAGRLDPERALELLGCLWIQFNQVMKLRDRIASRGFGGYPLFQNLILGGQTSEGADATNALSYLCLEATRRTRLPQPSLSVRVHPGAPPEFLRAAADLAREGLGMPAFFNDEAIIPVLLDMGVPLREARDYAEVGCVEPQAPGKTNGYYPAGFLNLGKLVTLALHDGRDPLTGRQLGPAICDPLTSYADLEAALDRQLDHAIRLMVASINMLDHLHGAVAPNPFVSLLVQDCLARGRCYEEGGAVYNYTSPNVVGLANAADALMAVKRLVFEEGRLGMAELREALSGNFEGREALRQLLVNRAPKYGNDADEVDALARELGRRILRGFKAFRNVRGGRFEPGLQSISAHALFRDAVAATPDGRTASMLLADGGISPAQGRDRRGPTAVIRSAAKLDQREASNGTLLNLKLSPASVAGETGLANLVALIRTYFQLGGQHVQFNVVNSAMLREAQVHPEQHRDLVVRVAGFSVLFTTIDAVLQEDIIARTEHSL
ncbi:MAG: formate C-acetyltransferase/glycerol dehydratase family glycyl radical enzyme [Candidatus Methylomirabilales bacterium]